MTSTMQAALTKWGHNGTVTAIWHDRDWPRAQEWVTEQLLELSLADEHRKQGRSTGRWVEPERGWRVFVKRHHLLPKWTSIAARMAPTRSWSPAVHEWHALIALRRLGISVPRPIAAAQFVGPDGRLRSLLVVAELTNHIAAHLWWQEVRRGRSWAAARSHAISLATAIGQITARLHAAQLFHKDLYLCHFFVPRSALAGGSLQPQAIVLIDLHRLRRHPLIYLHWLAKDLGQLLYSFREADYPSEAVEAFFSAYWQHSPWPRTARATIRWLAARKAERYWAHNVKHGTLWRPEVAEDLAGGREVA